MAPMGTADRIIADLMNALDKIVTECANPHGPSANYIAGVARYAMKSCDEQRIRNRDGYFVVKDENGAISVLRELHAMVLGECPSLLNEDSGGDANLAMRIESVLDAAEWARLVPFTDGQS